MSLQSAYGFNNLLKDGYKHYQGLEEAILRNIEACKLVSNMTRTSLGPNGMNKMVVNHLDKIFVTSDAATILKECEVHHPAAKMISMAARMQEQECGDMTNFVISFAGELLLQAEQLIKTGLHPSDIVSGYQTAAIEVERLLQTLKTHSVADIKNIDEVLPIINSALCPKIQTYYDHFGKLVADACIRANNGKRDFDTDCIRVGKIVGGSLYDSVVINGMILARAPETTFQRMEKPKIAVYSCPFVMEGGETKSNLLIKNAEDLLNFTKSEENAMETLVKGIADTGVNTVVIGGSIAELAIHYFEKHGIMVCKSMSKFELKRLCKCVHASALTKLGVPTQEELGYCDLVHVKEIGSHQVTIYEKSDDDCTLVTLMLRGATTTLLDDIERAIDDAINTYRVMIKSNKFLPGAGSVEAYLSNKLEEFAGKISSLDQYSCATYGACFEIIPKILLDNAGLNSNVNLPLLISQNIEGPTMGVDVLVFFLFLKILE